MIPVAVFMQQAAAREAARAERKTAWAARPRTVTPIAKSVAKNGETYRLRPDVECLSFACLEWRESYAAAYGEATRVHEWLDNRKRPSFMPDALGCCEGCGGFFNEAGEWAYVCQRCEKEVGPGELVGLFVPHMCPECEAEIARTARRCTLCRLPENRCSC